MKIISLVWKCKFETKNVSLCRKMANDALVYVLMFVVVSMSFMGCCVDELSRAKSRGCRIYRGNAAEISVGKYVLSWNIESLELTNGKLDHFQILDEIWIDAKRA